MHRTRLQLIIELLNTISYIEEPIYSKINRKIGCNLTAFTTIIKTMTKTGLITQTTSRTSSNHITTFYWITDRGKIFLNEMVNATIELHLQKGVNGPP